MLGFAKILVRDDPCCGSDSFPGRWTCDETTTVDFGVAATADLNGAATAGLTVAATADLTMRGDTGTGATMTLASHHVTLIRSGRQHIVTVAGFRSQNFQKIQTKRDVSRTRDGVTLDAKS